jgi:choline kinase
VKLLLKSTVELAVAYDPNWIELWSRRFANPLDDAETFRIDADGRILEIGLKPKTVQEVQGQYMGLLKFTPVAWAAIEQLRAGIHLGAQDKMDMTSTLQRLVELGISIHGVSIKSHWGEVDSDEDLARLSEMDFGPVNGFGL